MWQVVNPITLNNAACSTIHMEPHRDTKTGNVDNNSNAVKAFIQGGGNFLAQCEAVQTFEHDYLDGQPGRFITSLGITKTTNDNAVTVKKPFLAYLQMGGTVDGGQGVVA